jgi:hypothetical protein
MSRNTSVTCGEALSDGAPNAARSSSDENNLIGKVHTDSPFFFLVFSSIRHNDGGSKGQP